MSGKEASSMRSITRRFIPWMAALALALPACQSNIDDKSLSDNLVSVVLYNPLVGDSDVADLTTTGAVYRADKVEVTISGNARNSFASGFATDVILTSYTVQYTALDGISDALVPPDWGAAINQEIPVNTATTFKIEIVRVLDKMAGGALHDLDCTISVGAACGSVRRASVLVTFTGADIAGHKVSAAGALTINFADFIDPNSDDEGLFIQGTFPSPKPGI